MEVMGNWNSFVNDVNGVVLFILGLLPFILKIGLVFLAGVIINSLISKFIVKCSDKTKLDKTVLNFAKSAAKVIVYVVVFVVILGIFGIPSESIIAVIGSAGIAIALSLQSSLSNIAGGIFVLINKQFKSGDYIEINGDEGVVEDITIFATKIQTIDNKVIYIPNGTVSSSVITNYTQEQKRCVMLKITISSNNDVSTVKSVLNSVISGNKKILSDEAALIKLAGFETNSLVFDIRAWTKTEDFWDVYFDMFEDIKVKFDENGIKFAENISKVMIDK